MSFTVRLTADTVSVEPGATAPVTLEVTNRGTTPDTFEILVEGLDGDWTAIPVPTFPIPPGESHSEKLFLKPPRVSESVAGTYPFVVKVRSLESGEIRPTQGVLEIRPFHHISVDLQPRRGVVTAFSPRRDFNVTVLNLGNTEHTLQMFANDPDDACAFEFESDKVTVGPGQQKEVEMTATAARRSLLSNTRLHSFSVTARSIPLPTLAGNAQGQLEQRSLISPGAFFALLLMIVLAVGWVLMMPKPPTIDALTVEPPEIEKGQVATIKWRASPNTRSVRVVINGRDSFTGVDPNGQIQYTARETGTLTVTAVAMTGQHQSREKTAVLTVREPAVIPAPEIRDFRIEPTNQKLGEPFMVRYRLGPSVTRATLSPLGIELDVKSTERQLEAQMKGTITYTLRAENAAGQVEEKQIKVTVTEQSTARIATFAADRMSFDSQGGIARISYSFVNAVRAELLYDDKKEMLDPAGGSIDIAVNRTTEFTIRAYDVNDVPVARRIRVVVREPEPPPVTDAGGTAGTTGTTTGETTGTTGGPTTTGTTTAGTTGTATTAGAGR